MLDLDHVGTAVSEKTRAEGCGDTTADLDDTNAVERRHVARRRHYRP
jgi:hypothetical protein